MPDNPSRPVRHLIWGSELSPFALKIRAMLQHAQLPHRFLPAQGRRAENARAWGTIELAKLRRDALRFPRTSPLDEYPLVPYLVEDDRRVLYDSSAIGRWIDATFKGLPLLFPSDPATSFVAQLIDEAFDEFGLYMLHHNRWVVSASDNDAGQRLAREFSWLLPVGLKGVLAHQFSRRQVRRLPYLFSVAPENLALAGVPRRLAPPSRVGFPPTHALLEEAWFAYVDAVESILASRPFLLGERFTIADASVFGHLWGNSIDPSACLRLLARAPRTHAWLDAIRRGTHVGSTGESALDGSIAPLLRIVARTFLPLMRANEAAYLFHARRGETIFNERAFNLGRALYEGELLGHPFRSVAKTFQVRAWRELRAAWLELTRSQQATVESLADVDFAAAAIG
ncbi:MAG: glutathione S-transferase family protein [Deltaproteobacteria bacterium]|nr:glutathione S-transferase family protein [Deltaproteobacteria bacterium]